MDLTIPMTIQLHCLRVVNCEPSLFSYILPPGSITFIAGHNNMLNFDTLSISQLLTDLFDAAPNNSRRCEAFVFG
jgi:hypothetical protein